MKAVLLLLLTVTPLVFGADNSDDNNTLLCIADKLSTVDKNSDTQDIKAASPVRYLVDVNKGWKKFDNEDYIGTCQVWNSLLRCTHQHPTLMIESLVVDYREMNFTLVGQTSFAVYVDVGNCSRL